MKNCEKHNWLYEEFDEVCPLCEVIDEYTDRILKLIQNYITQTSGRVFDAAGILGKVSEDVKNGRLD